MFIQIRKAPDGSGRNIVQIRNDDHPSDCAQVAEFLTTHVVSLTVEQEAEVSLVGTRPNGTRITVDQKGDVWLASKDATHYDNVQRVEET